MSKGYHSISVAVHPFLLVQAPAPLTTYPFKIIQTTFATITLALFVIINMQIKSLLLLASMAGGIVALPVTQDAVNTAAVDSRSAMPVEGPSEEESAVIEAPYHVYEDQKRSDAEDASREEYAVIEAPYHVYEHEKRGAAESRSV